MKTIKILKLHPDAKIPYKQYEGDACFDLYAVEDTVVWAGSITTVRLGIAWEMPKGYEAVVRSRSSSFINKNLHVHIGTIDQQYRGEIICAVSYIIPPKTPPSILYYTILKGESVAQVAFRKVPSFEMVEVTSLSDTDRGNKGFGSTDKIKFIDNGNGIYVDSVPLSERLKQ